MCTVLTIFCIQNVSSAIHITIMVTVVVQIKIQQATGCVSFFNQSTQQGVERLKYHQQTNTLYAERKFAPGVKPLTDVVTRW